MQGTEAWQRRFHYVGPDGRAIQDADCLKRIRSLPIPPAWADVLDLPFASGHLQATEHDARGRKQYRYHPLYGQTRDEAKYGRMLAFGGMPVRMRRQVHRDLAKPGLPKTTSPSA